MAIVKKTFYDKEGNRVAISTRLVLDCITPNLKKDIELYAMKQIFDYADYKQLTIFKPPKEDK